MDSASLRNFKDFLQVYNGMSEMCFLRCVQNLNDRTLSSEEAACVNTCARKHINVNHKIMQVYMEVQPLIVQQRMDEMSKKAEEQMEALNKKEAEALKSAESSTEPQQLTDGVTAAI